MLLGNTTILENKSCILYLVCTRYNSISDQLLGYAPVITIEQRFPLGPCGIYVTTACS
jgi:hypothetical protein